MAVTWEDTPTPHLESEAAPPALSHDCVVPPPTEEAFVSYAPHSLPRDLPLAPSISYESKPRPDEQQMGSWSFEHTFESSTPSPPASPRKRGENDLMPREGSPTLSEDALSDPFDGDTADFPLGEAFSPEIALPLSQVLPSTASHGRPCADAVDVPPSSGERGGVPLSNFYPPLPSYEDDCMSSPSFHDESELLHVRAASDTPHLLTENKLNEDGQMLLHRLHLSMCLEI